MKGDMTGHIYFTVDDLAIAKGTFEQWLDGEMDMYIKATMPGERTAVANMDYTFDNVYAKMEEVLTLLLRIKNAISPM